jgi:predicted aspartyl protease
MISGEFGSNGELFFEIEVIAANGDILPIEVLLDTGFTTGWLALDSQDIQILGWSSIEPRQIMTTARGDELFDIFAGIVILDGQEYTIPVIATIGLAENLLGLQWLRTRRLVVDFPSNILTLEDNGSPER